MIHKLTEVMSGGQNGVDLAGVCAAKVCGIPTGGWCAKGWKTLDGPRPRYEKFFGMKECQEGGYPPRTRANVRESDGTLRIAENFKSPGELCTLKAIFTYDKPYFNLMKEDLTELRYQSKSIIRIEPEDVIDWIVKHNIKKLNIAGNSAQTSPGIAREAFVYLINVFTRMGYSAVADERLYRYCLDGGL